MWVWVFVKKTGPGGTKWRPVSGEGERRNFPFLSAPQQSHLPGQQHSELQKSYSNSFCFFGSGTKGCEWSPLEMRHEAAHIGCQLKDQSGKSVFIKKNTLSAKVQFFPSLEYLPASTRSSLLTQSEGL